MSWAGGRGHKFERPAALWQPRGLSGSRQIVQLLTIVRLLWLLRLYLYGVLVMAMIGLGRDEVLRGKTGSCIMATYCSRSSSLPSMHCCSMSRPKHEA